MAAKTDESPPLLLFCHGKARKTQIVYNISDKSHSTYSLPNMRNKSVLASNFGWLLLGYYIAEDCYLLNLHSKEKVNLPKTRFRYRKCIFTSAPTDPNCRVLLIELGGHVVRFCKVGDDNFLKQNIDINGCALMGAIAFKGKVYGRTSRCALVEVEFRARSLQFRQVIQELGKVGRAGIECIGTYLVESEGELLYVYEIYLGYHDRDAETFDFFIFRADFERREWVEMKSLGDRALFLSSSGSGKSCSASQANIKGNCIYYVELDNRNLYVFDMEDRSVSASSPYRKVDNENLDLYWN